MTLPSPNLPPGHVQDDQLEARQYRRLRLRQLAWASVPVWSFGLLSCVPFLRLALARRRARDWAVFAAYFAVIPILLVLSPTGTKGTVSELVGGALLLLIGVAAVHAFVAFRPGPDPLGPGTPPSISVPSNKHALELARERMHRREAARKLAESNPDLARELRIGRPDLPREYDDGGLVDVNHVPIEAMASALGLTPQESTAVAAARTQLGRFSSPEELSVYTQLPPDRVDALRDKLWFG